MANNKTKSRANGKPIIIAITAFIMAGVLAAGVCCLGFASRNTDGKWFGNFKNISDWHWGDYADNPTPDIPDTPDVPDKPDEPTDEKPDTGNAVISGVENNGVKLMSAKLPKEAYAANGIDPLADTAYTVTATVEPADADDKTIDWTISFKNPSSSWANGKSVTDYGTITATSDGALTANFVCKQAFGEQIIITATSRDNPNAKGTTTVDYRKRLTSTTTGIFDGNTSSTKVWDTANNLYDSNTRFNDTFGIGTIDDTVKSHKMAITTHSNLRSNLSPVFPGNQEGYSATAEYVGKISGAYGRLQWEMLFCPDPGSVSTYAITGLFYFCSDTVDYGEWEINSTKYNKLRTCFLNSSIDFVVTVKTELEHGATYTESYNVNVLDSSLKIKVSSVNVTGSIII